MPEYILPLADAAKEFRRLDAFTQGYIEAAFFCDANPDNEELKDATFADLADIALTDAKADCAAFQSSNEYRLGLAYNCADYSPEQAGRDFWFTRNHHGVGFWDRQQLPNALGRALTDAAQAFGSTGLYVGDSGKVYFE